MDVSLLGVAGSAMLSVLEPYRLMMLSAGVLMGLALGIIPGIGGLLGLALLLPFTFTLDPVTAFALLLGMKSVTGTSDTIPAILFGVPGGSSAQATVLDGYAMAKKGEAGRALAAAYTASLIGGLFGAALLAALIPVMRPLVLQIGSPELLALSIFGVSMVATLSGSAPLRGLALASFGVMLSMIGTDPQTGTLRWTMGQLYLWEGVPLVPIALGLFAVPELADLAIRRAAIASHSRFNVREGMGAGVRDALTNWWLVLRCGGIGAAVGAIPGLGASVVDWLAYGHAMQTVKGARETFGKGDVRGLIAPESANNSITAGSLIPTIAFGVPGSASMAILLGAFLIQGLIPGPEMLTTNIEITFSMIWSIAIANILGAGICFLFSGQLAKLATLRYTLILPIVLCVVFMGAYQETRDWGDIYALLVFSVLGWTMKRLGWARPPLMLGFVLGALIERYMSISVVRYGADWLLRPAVVVILTVSVLGMVRPFLRETKRSGGLKRMLLEFHRPTFKVADLFYVLLIVVVAIMMFQASGWRAPANTAPIIVGCVFMITAGISLVYQVLRRGGVSLREGEQRESAVHMDISGDEAIDTRTFLVRSGIFLAWFGSFIVGVSLIGFLPSSFVFIIAYMRVEGREPWWLSVTQATCFTIFIHVLADRIMHIPWPATVLGKLIPALTIIPTV
ncbi:tripartite tricarboxylate transporter permease [Shinella sp.]|uniref:tripartite tricarboxylate transporter permease n=1 Tax=Shinella sp. TaxID=1870904 RepID=UPI003F7074FD